MNPEPKSDAGLVVSINDGPDEKPNYKRIVKLIYEDTSTGMILCRDERTGEILRVDRGKIIRAKQEAMK